MKFGIVGAYGGQAKRIINYNLLKNHEIVVFEHDFLKKREILSNIDYQISYDIVDLLKCDAIFILSATCSHFFYLNYFVDNNYSGYIFCEKPPVHNDEELKCISKYSEVVKKHILFDFNLRKSNLQKIFDSSEELDLGHLRLMTIVNGHGLAFKDTYKNSWRNDPDSMKHGVFQTVGIHYVDFALRNFGQYLNYSYDEIVSSPVSKVADNCYLNIVFEEGIHVNMYNSYTVPLVEKIEMIFENALVEVNGNSVSIFGPRDVIDINGYFTSPPLTQQYTIDMGLWDESIFNMVSYFISIVEKKVDIDVKEFDDAIESNRFVLELG